MFDTMADLRSVEHLDFEICCTRQGCTVHAVMYMVVPCCGDHIPRCTGHAVEEREGAPDSGSVVHRQCGSSFDVRQVRFIPIPKGAAK